VEDRHLISVDELRAAGALDVPPAWRKSLGQEPRKERELFSGLSEEDDTLPENQLPTGIEPDRDPSVDELR
jgi:hypothetical protein